MKRSIILLAALLTLMSATAQDIKACRGTVPGAYNFWLYTPESAKAEAAELAPLVIFLHGASLCGNDLNRAKRYGTIAAIERGLKLDAYVVAPQNPGGAWSPEKIMKIVDYVIDNVGGVDTSRIYVLGMSLGGYGTIDLAATYPDRIAAAMAICGGGGVKTLGNLAELPLWIVHGTADAAVSVRESDRVVEAIRRVDPTTSRLIYSRVPGMNHGQPARLLYMPKVYSWLFSHSIEDYDRALSEGFPISLDMMRDAYRTRGTSMISVDNLPEAVKRPVEDYFDPADIQGLPEFYPPGE